jgi:two-component system NtrC family sensor kinase
MPSEHAARETQGHDLTAARVAGEPVATLDAPQDTALFLNQNIRHLDRLASIGTLSASMAHEIKNALVAVRTFIDLLRKSAEHAELAELATKEVKRIDSIVSQMLRFAGPARPTFAPLHLHELLDHALRLAQFQMDDKRITLTRGYQTGSDLVSGDTYQLEQAFINLFFNAIEAMGQGGQLTVTTLAIAPGAPELAACRIPARPHLQIAVRDTGAGIAPELLPRLFEPFFTTKPKGTGLGLPITRRIIQEHHGAIAVASEPGRGTIFTILLPLHVETN